MMILIVMILTVMILTVMILTVMIQMMSLMILLRCSPQVLALRLWPAGAIASPPRPATGSLP